MLSLRSRWWMVCLLLALTAGLGFVAASRAPGAHAQRMRVVQVTVPGEDRFTPFAITIRPGQTVRWVNQDTDNHTVVSDDAFNSAGHNGTNQLLVGTDANGGKPGTFTLRFDHPGTFVYYCRFHSHLDADNQPVAPGPLGGIQDANGNFGTPMMGVITVLPGGDDGRD
jgi:plastocyanin